ncbi:tRNA lysidine(34) synthetase TilS [bacterium]
MNEKKFLKRVGRFVNQHELIKADDTVAVGVSGGKDSFALLNVLHKRLEHLPIAYKIVAVHIDFGLNPNQTEAIKKFCQDTKIECIIEKYTFPDSEGGMNCFWCSWNRRKALFNSVEKYKIRKLALAHHLDDYIETVFMNMFYQAKVESILPKTIFFDGKLEMVRPFLNLTTTEITKYADYKKFPIENHKCPFGIESKRMEFRKLLDTFDKLDPTGLYKYNIFNAVNKEVGELAK